MFPGISDLFDLLLILSIIIMPNINAIPSMLPMAIPAIAPTLIPDVGIGDIGIDVYGGSTIIIVGGYELSLVAEYVYIMKLKFFIVLNYDIGNIPKIRYVAESVKFTAVFSVKSKNTNS